MNKLPKEIYVEEISDEPIYFTNAEECAVPGETIVLAVYRLIGTVEVSTQMKQEVIVKKAPKAKKKTRTESIPVDGKPLLQEMVLVDEDEPARNPLLDELRVTATS